MKTEQLLKLYPSRANQSPDSYKTSIMSIRNEAEPASAEETAFLAIRQLELAELCYRTSPDNETKAFISGLLDELTQSTSFPEIHKRISYLRGLMDAGDAAREGHNAGLPRRILTTIGKILA